MKRRIQMLFCLSATLWSVQYLPGGEPAPSADATDLRTGASLERRLGVSREALAQRVSNLIVQQDVMARAKGELEKAYDGTPAMAMKINLVGLMMTKDRAELLPEIAAAAEELRWDIFRERTHRKALRDACDAEIGRGEQQIQALAKKILDGNDAQGKALSPQALTGGRRLLYQLILKKQEQSQEKSECDQSIATLESECKSLGDLDEGLGFVADDADLYAQRCLSAVEHEARRVVSHDLQAGRQVLRQAIEVIRSTTPANSFVTSSRAQGGVVEGAPITSATRQLQGDLTQEQAKVVDEFLQKMQGGQRLPQAAPAPSNDSPAPKAGAAEPSKGSADAEELVDKIRGLFRAKPATSPRGVRRLVGGAQDEGGQAFERLRQAEGLMCPSYHQFPSFITTKGLENDHQNITHRAVSDQCLGLELGCRSCGIARPGPGAVQCRKQADRDCR